jgi:hypothetical protein
MTMAVRFSTTAINGCTGAATKITQLQNLCQDPRALLFQYVERLRQGALPILTYAYVRIITIKKENSHSCPCRSRTRCSSPLPGTAKCMIHWRASVPSCRSNRWIAGSPQEFVKPLFSLSFRDWGRWDPIRLGDIGSESPPMFTGTSALFETHRRRQPESGPFFRPGSCPAANR